MAVEIPEKCLTCPHTFEARGMIKMMERQEDVLIQQSMSAALDEQFGHMEVPDDLVVSVGEDGDEEELRITSGPQYVRVMMGKQIQFMRHSIEHNEKAISEFTEGCVGAVALRGVQDEEEITAYLCRSPKQYYVDDGIVVEPLGHMVESSLVMRKPAEPKDLDFPEIV